MLQPIAESWYRDRDRDRDRVHLVLSETSKIVIHVIMAQYHAWHDSRLLMYINLISALDGGEHAHMQIRCYMMIQSHSVYIVLDMHKTKSMQ